MPKISSTNSQQQQQVNKESKETLLEKASKALSPIQCLYQMTGYWFYEYCHLKRVVQFHSTQEGLRESEYVLGKYSEIQPTIQYVNDSNSVYAYVNMEWQDGTFCELTHTPRSIVIEIKCAKDQREYISRIQETSSCKYIMTIYTPKLCEAGSPFIPKSTFHETLITCYSETHTGNVGTIQSLFPKTEIKKPEKKESLPIQENLMDMNILDLGKLLKQALSKEDEAAVGETDEDPERIIVYQV